MQTVTCTYFAYGILKYIETWTDNNLGHAYTVITVEVEYACT